MRLSRTRYLSGHPRRIPIPARTRPPAEKYKPAPRFSVEGSRRANPVGCLARTSKFAPQTVPTSPGTPGGRRADIRRGTRGGPDIAALAAVTLTYSAFASAPPIASDPPPHHPRPTSCSPGSNPRPASRPGATPSMITLCCGEIRGQFARTTPLECAGLAADSSVGDERPLFDRTSGLREHARVSDGTGGSRRCRFRISEGPRRRCSCLARSFRCSSRAAGGDDRFSSCPGLGR